MAGLWWRPTDAQLNKAYFFYVGRNFLIENKYQDAIEVLNILLRADSTAYEAYFLRGIAKYNLDDLLGAEQDFTLAIRQNPVFTIALQYRAITRSRLGNYDDALRDFQQAIDLRPDLPSAYYSRGVTYLLTQQFEKAIEDFSTYIHYDNKVADAYLNRNLLPLPERHGARPCRFRPRHPHQLLRSERIQPPRSPLYDPKKVRSGSVGFQSGDSLRFDLYPRLF